jgi:RHS repeat-associated protein
LLTEIVDQSGLALTTNMAYNNVGDVLTKADPRGHTAAFQYNNNRQVTEITSPAPFNYITKHTYDENGNLTKIERETGIPATPWQVTEFEYTRTNKKKSKIDPQGFVTSYQYDELNRLWKMIDAELNVTEFLYNQTGKQFRTIDGFGNISEEYLYTSNGLRQSHEDANENLTSYLYDDFDRLWRIIYPDGSYEEFQHDEASNLMRKRVRTGRLITYEYDSLNRLTSKELSDPGDQGYNFIQNSYDLSNRILDVTDLNGTIQHAYDSAGRLESVTYPDLQVVSYEHDDAGNRTKLTYPDGFFVTYTYDELNRLVDIREMGVTPVVQYGYDSLSRRLNLTYGNGTSVEYDYEIDNDLKTVTHQLNSGTLSWAYTYDNVGNRITQINNQGTTTYTYDLIYQLTNADENGSNTSYQLDAAGNRISLTTDSSIVNYSTNQLNQYTEVDGTPYSYDGNGNLRNNGTSNYVYDAENRLIRAYTDGSFIEFDYDPFGRRITKYMYSGVEMHKLTKPKDGGGASPPPLGPVNPMPVKVIYNGSYVYDGNQVIMEFDNQSGQLLRRFICSPKLDEPISMRTDTETYYYHFDGLGSVVALSDASGLEAETYSYSPYGSVNHPSLVGNPYLFTGRRYDEETGLYHYRNRVYDPNTGRFLQVDPMNIISDLNLYAYCWNNPVNLRDPSGLCASMDNRHIIPYIDYSWQGMIPLLGGWGPWGSLGITGYLDLSADPWYDFLGIGLHWGAGAGYGVELDHSLAVGGLYGESIHSAEGLGGTMGGTGAALHGGSVNVGWSDDMQTWTVDVGYSQGAGAEVHGGRVGYGIITSGDAVDAVIQIGEDISAAGREAAATYRALNTPAGARWLIYRLSHY